MLSERHTSLSHALGHPLATHFQIPPAKHVCIPKGHSGADGWVPWASLSISRQTTILGVVGLLTSWLYYIVLRSFRSIPAENEVVIGSIWASDKDDRDLQFTHKVLSVDLHQPDENQIVRAVQALRAGQLVVLPTETVYGIAADPSIPGAIDSLYAAKGRDPNKPVALLVANKSQVKAMGADFGISGEALADRFWPGPLTLVLPLPDGSFQGFRVPAHAVPVAVAEHFATPLLLTSANRSGEPDTKTAQEALMAVGEHVALVLDSGPTQAGIPSTVVKIINNTITLLREGMIPYAEILAVHSAHCASEG